MLDVYDAYEHAVERADALKLLCMFVYGGVYADLDVAPCDGAEAALAANAGSFMLVRDPARGTQAERAAKRIGAFFFQSPRARRVALHRARSSVGAGFRPRTPLDTLDTLDHCFA